MRKFCSLVLAGLLALSMAEPALAQNPDDQWLIGVGAHALDFRAVDPLFHQFFKTEHWEVTPPLSRIWVARNLIPRLNAQVSASVGQVDNARWGFDDQFFLDVDAGLQFRLGNDRGVFKVFDPYLVLDLGYNNYDYSKAKYGLGGNEYIYKDLKEAAGVLIPSTYKPQRKNFITAGGGLGFNLWLTEKFGLNYQGQYKHMLKGKKNCQDYFLHSFGFVFRFGSTDTDGDGIIDSKDACPDTAGLAQFDGCPDTDGDGIPDKDEKCPDEAGPRSNAGCPIRDRDADGIPDDRDRCPDKPGVASQGGCPEVTRQNIEELSDVYFDFGKHRITPGLSKVLDEVAQFIAYHPTYRFQISGYADSIGSEAINQKVSRRRAEAVAAYLYQHGVRIGQLLVKSFGEKNPAASNKTEAGRAKNRRVEIRVAS